MLITVPPDSYLMLIQALNYSKAIVVGIVLVDNIIAQI